MKQILEIVKYLEDQTFWYLHCLSAASIVPAMADERTGDPATAAEVWRLLLSGAMAHFGHTSHILAELGLTPGHMRALLLLDPVDGRPMGALAQDIACDASTMTWLVDRLEDRGLVERRPSRTDRRVKTVVLTQQGAATKAELERRLYDPPPGLREIDPGALAALRTALQAMAAPRGESGPKPG